MLALPEAMVNALEIKCKERFLETVLKLLE
jgi:hypothetical protein